MSDLVSETSPWPQAIVFDLDGTLIDSAPDIAAAAEQALTAYSLSIDADRVRAWIGDGSRKLIERALASIGIEADDTSLDALTQRFSEHYAQTPCRHTQLFAGAVGALARLQERSIRLAICTNKPHDIAGQVIDTLGLSQYIDTFIGGGRYPLKPAPDGILACLHTLGCRPVDALYIGDMPVDREAGHAAGLPVLLARFGYACNNADSLGADAIFDHWRDVEQAIDAVTQYVAANRWDRKD
ncbi:MAG: HAD hydrolase-like protein [Salinisphaera sp.]|jgi:phosphoglycolate phosphatase|nr:HAD hydrolase-like protein [Salinisphaera sp.]